MRFARFVDIDLDGMVCRAGLNDDLAPITCGAIWQALPFGGQAVHAMVSGSMFRMLEATPVQDLPLESPNHFQFPGLVVFHPVLKEIGFCVGPGRFHGAFGGDIVTPWAQLEEDLQWMKAADDLRFSGSKPIEFRRAADQVTRFRYTQGEGQLELTLGTSTFRASLLDDSPAAAAIIESLPIRGNAENSAWGLAMTEFRADQKVSLEADFEHRTIFHWPGYLYLDPATHNLYVCYGDARENIDGVPRALVPFARLDGDVEPYAVVARQQLLEGTKIMELRSAPAAKGN